MALDFLARLSVALQQFVTFPADIVSSIFYRVLMWYYLSLKALTTLNRLLQVTTTGVLACLKLDRLMFNRIRLCYNGLYSCRCRGKTSACHTAELLKYQCAHLASMDTATFCASPPVFRTADKLDLQQPQLAEQALDAAFDFLNPLPIQAIFSPLAMNFRMSSEVRGLIQQMSP